MKSLSGPLRRAQAEVIPLVPTLAPKLEGQPTIIRDALHDALRAEGVDPAKISEVNLNKTERYTIVGHAIGEHRKLLIEGEGPSARFRRLGRVSLWNFDSIARQALIAGFSLRSSRFSHDLQKTMDEGAEQIKSTFSGGMDPEHNWWAQAEKRYRLLGSAAVVLSGERFITTEGKELLQGLRGPALANVIPIYTKFIKRRVKGQKAERVKAAHDLAYLVTGLAGLHLEELPRAHSFSSLRVRVEYDKEADAYRLKRDSKNSHWRKVFPRLRALPNARLKCPAHVASAGESDDVRFEDTNLDYYVHAAINAAADYDLL